MSGEEGQGEGPVPAKVPKVIPLISLQGLEPITVYERPCTQQAPAANAGALNNNNDEDPGQGNGGGSGGGGGGGIGKNNRLVPKPDDEPSVICKLSGASFSIYTQLCGWSGLMPSKFYNIRSSTHLHPMTNGKGEVVKAAEELMPKCITLQEMEHLIGGVNNVINCPIFVHVVAKRKVDTFPHKKQLLIIPQIVIADASGYAVLCSFNEGLVTVFKEVEVGDQLLISRCLPQTPRRVYHRGLFSDTMFLNLEIKLQFHTVRNHYIHKFSPLKVVQFKMPEVLFDDFCEIKIPSEVETDLNPQVLPDTTANLRPASESEQYFDLIGVLTYVGRIERYQNGDPQELECLENDAIVIKQVDRFIEFRWVYMIDQTSRPLPVKLCVNNITLSHQPSLVPGAILVLTHCQILECPVSGKYVATSFYTQMYLEGNIEKYFLLHPSKFRDKTCEIMVRQNYVKIMSRADLQLIIGGTHSLKISDPQKFKTNYTENSRKFLDFILSDKPMLRRESRRHYFEGQILRVYEVKDENLPKLHFIDNPIYDLQSHIKRTEYKVIENFYSYSILRNTSWYAFQRTLPRFDRFHLGLQRCRDIVKKITGEYKHLMGPLQMPALMPNYQEHGPPPEMERLPKHDGAPYLLMDIVNPDTMVWHTVIWKSAQFSYEEKLKRVDDAKGKSVLCQADVFCTEPDAALEVNLLDFVLNDDN